MKLVHWPLMGGLLHLVPQGGDWVGPQPAQAPPCCTKCNSPPISASVALPMALYKYVYDYDQRPVYRIAV